MFYENGVMSRFKNLSAETFTRFTKAQLKTCWEQFEHYGLPIEYKELRRAYYIIKREFRKDNANISLARLDKILTKDMCATLVIAVDIKDALRLDVKGAICIPNIHIAREMVRAKITQLKEYFGEGYYVETLFSKFE